MIRKILTSAVGIILIGGLTLFSFQFISAEETVAPTEVTQTLRQVCPSTIIAGINVLKSDFYVSLETQLESPDLTSERLHDVYEDFHSVKDDINTLAGSPLLNREGPSETVEVYESCRDYVQSQLSEIDAVFVQYVAETTARKRNFIMIEKMDSINEGLTGLQEQLHDIRQDINTFYDQVPCFVQECLIR